MNLELWFAYLNNLALAGWFVLALYPRRKTWVFPLTGLIIPSVMGLVYAVLFIPNIAGTNGAGYGSLEQVQALMNNPPLLLAGWVHYLAFDLAIGTFIAMQSDKIGLSRIIQIPLLFLTFMFGPIGLMAFVILQSVQKLSSPLMKGETA